MGSPIEKMLLDAICAAAAGHGFHVELDEEEFGLSADPDSEPHAEHFTCIETDVAIGSYRVDIMLGGITQLAIECDGHDFHDRTKQQAAYDRSRDRELLLAGIPTIRFTGSEIVHSPERCASEALRIFAKIDAEAWRVAWLSRQTEARTGTRVEI